MFAFYFLFLLRKSSEGFTAVSSISLTPRRSIILQSMGDMSGNSNESETTKVERKWDVQRYQNQHSFVWQYGSSLLELLEPRPGERILDIGSGSGELTNAISNFCDEVQCVGMDRDLNMVETAKKQFPYLDFFQGDVRDFVVDEPYDAIFSNAALHWVPAKDVERSASSMSNALKKEGRFVVEFGGKGNVRQIVEATSQILPGVASPWYFPSIAEYSSILERHGIEVQSAILFDRPTPLKNDGSGIKNWLRMFGSAFFEEKQADEIDRVLDRIEDVLRPKLFDGEKWVADYRRIRIVGRKL